MKVTLLMAMTLDGKIARNNRHFPDWTGREDKKLFIRMTKRAGVIIMGSKTFDTIGHPLPERKNVVLTRNASRQSQTPDLVYTDRPPAEIIADLAGEGYTEVILAGGSQVNSLFARENLIDEIVMTIAPRVFGTGIALFSQETDLKLELIQVDTIDAHHVFLRYRVCR